ncbi:MAG: hypothetical protein J4N64_09005, partial [Chloroflexi bacterium]|nr:hypothetical protein [Chloroflexota bacterium]
LQLDVAVGEDDISLRFRHVSLNLLRYGGRLPELRHRLINFTAGGWLLTRRIARIGAVTGAPWKTEALD